MLSPFARGANRSHPTVRTLSTMYYPHSSCLSPDFASQTMPLDPGYDNGWSPKTWIGQHRWRDGQTLWVDVCASSPVYITLGSRTQLERCSLRCQIPTVRSHSLPITSIGSGPITNIVTIQQPLSAHWLVTEMWLGSSSTRAFSMHRLLRVPTPPLLPLPRLPARPSTL